MDSSFITVLITVPNPEVGRRVAYHLLERRLAACVNIISSVNSIYIWQGEIHDDEEALLLVKTRSDLFESQLIPAVKEVHPYDVPEIIALPVLQGSSDYLHWIQEVTQG